MPDLPEEAVRAAAEAMQEEEDTRTYPSNLTLARIALEAAEPLRAQREREIRADERRKVAAQLRRAAEGRREYDKGEPPSGMHEALVMEAATFDTAARLVETPIAMLGLIPSWMWTAEEEALLDRDPPASQIGEGQ